MIEITTKNYNNNNKNNNKPNNKMRQINHLLQPDTTLEMKFKT